MDKPFKLFSLPKLALDYVLKFLNPIELFELSQCSKKATDYVKQANTKNFRIQVNLSPDYVDVNGYVFYVGSNAHELRTFRQEDRIFSGKKAKTSKTVPQQWFENRGFMTKDINAWMELYNCRKDSLISVFDDQSVGIRRVVSHLKELFKRNIYSLTIPSDPNSKKDFDMIIDGQSEIEELVISRRSMTVENLTALFDKLKVTESLELCEDFSAVRNFPFTVKSIRIFVSSWITSNHLNLMKDCVVIQLKGSTLTNQDVKSFLDKWKSGDYPNLQYLYIRSDNLSEDFTVFGLPTLHNFSGSPFEKQ
ncbi:hypothetical protein CRE_16886 [Caenorhabditis remanei]|uniref:F-box domain-containing protein n=1 Tax=Caenorhabditis remanei TaxID=31234 RepID=E3MS68_CAERE|nr:hypothetical protein CRE_16886 [Caenorhabditis remanei]